ncbi:hypothetical protein EDC01DRAFT_137607 [Geopyxis carbonaria]|nr:hypothetical protein EDC01DRAFT_137607 [Geopyxis carbonaria]
MRAPVGERPLLVGPDAGPEPPYPLHLAGPVIQGFGRGSKELQIPTANIPIEGLSVGGCSDIESGVYYGFASLDLPPPTATAAPTAEQGAIKADDAQLGNDLEKGGNVFPMVMSIGWNPFYKNEVRSVEVHIIHAFEEDFYGVEMRLSILGWIRPEFDYISRDALIEDIRMDIKVGVESLKREGYKKFMEDPYLLDFGKDVTKAAEKS